MQHSKPPQRQASKPIPSEPPHPADTNNAPDSGHAQPHPTTCEASPLLYWWRVSGQWDDGWWWRWRWQWGHDPSGAANNSGRIWRGFAGAPETGGDKRVIGCGPPGRGGQDPATGRVRRHTGTFLCGICTFSLCLRRFFPGSLTSSQNPKNVLVR